MAWRSERCQQRGNSTVTWTFWGEQLSTHDCIVVGETGRTGSWLRIEHIDRCRRPKSYKLRVKVIGSSGVGFRAYAEQMN